jgi:hypothetical protein
MIGHLGSLPPFFCYPFERKNLSRRGFAWSQLITPSQPPSIGFAWASLPSSLFGFLLPARFCNCAARDLTECALEFLEEALTAGRSRYVRLPGFAPKMNSLDSIIGRTKPLLQARPPGSEPGVYLSRKYIILINICQAKCSNK